MGYDKRLEAEIAECLFIYIIDTDLGAGRNRRSYKDLKTYSCYLCLRSEKAIECWRIDLKNLFLTDVFPMNRWNPFQELNNLRIILQPVSEITQHRGRIRT